MSNYRFVMLNAILIIGAVMLLGPLGMAEALDDDLKIGDAEQMLAEGEIDSLDEVDFDTSRLLFESPDDIVEEGRQNALAWTGNTNIRGEEYGFARYDVSEVNAITIDAFTGRFFSEIGYILDGEGEELLFRGTTTIDVSNASEFEIRIGDTDDHYVLRIQDPDSEINTGDFFDQSEIQEINLDIQESAFDRIAAFISSSLQALASIPGMFIAWIEFIAIIPGLAGRAMQMYIAAFSLYIIAELLTIG